MAYPQPPPPPPEPPPQAPEPRDPFFIDTRKPSPSAIGKSARMDKPGKTPKFLLLVATICWPIASVLYGGYEHAKWRQWGNDFATAASYDAISTVTGLYFIFAIICLAWWFYVKD